MKLIVEKIEMDIDLKAKIESTINKKNLVFTYFNGYLTKFDKCNVESLSPHKILISNQEKNLLVMYYADYIETDGLYFIDGEKEGLTIKKLKEYVNNYF